jgi:hypothetical protein
MPPDGKSTVALCDSDCGLRSDMVPRLLVDEESDDDNGKDVFIDVDTSLDTSHDAQKFRCHPYPIPLSTLHGHYNTVHLLPPANGPPTPSLAEPDTDVEGMKMDKQFVNMLENSICHCGAPTKLNSNHAQVEISYKLKDILHALCHIMDWQSEHHQQQLNPAECWSADDSKTRNLHLTPLSDDVSSPIIRSHHDSLHHGESKMPTIDPQDLVGHSFLLPQQEDG